MSTSHGVWSYLEHHVDDGRRLAGQWHRQTVGDDLLDEVHDVFARCVGAQRHCKQGGTTHVTEAVHSGEPVTSDEDQLCVCIS